MTDLTALLAKAPSDVKEQALLADDEARIAAALAREHITLDKGGNAERKLCSAVAGVCP